MSERLIALARKCGATDEQRHSTGNVSANTGYLVVNAKVLEAFAAALSQPHASEQGAAPTDPVAWWRISYIDDEGNSDADVQIGKDKPTEQIMRDNGFPWQPLYGNALATPAPREHTAAANCWCQPEVDYVDPDTGTTVYIHRGNQ